MDLEELEKHEEITSISFDHVGAHLASTHMLQGGASSGWNTALILKSDDTDQDLIKALEQISVTLSMEEFLQQFFQMYSDDAELLTTILGFETEAEYLVRLANEGMQAPDRWGTNESWEEYKKRNLETRADKVKFVEKANTDGINSLTTVEKIAVLELQSEIEKGVEFLGGFDAVLEKMKPATSKSDKDAGSGLSKGTVAKAAASAEDKSENNPSVDKANDNKSNTPKGNTMTTKVEKTADELQLEKMASLTDQLAALEKSLADANKDSLEKAAKLESLEKAEEARKVSGAQVLVKSFGFIAEDNQEAVVDFMVKSVDAPLVADILKQAQVAVATAVADLEKAKADFGVTEHGVEGDAVVVSKGQETVDKSITSFAETLKNLAL